MSPRKLANLMKRDTLPFEAEAEAKNNERTAPDANNSNNTGKSSDPARARWMSWMRAGTPRGVEDIKMREARELGGVPRSDRYSSRDWFHNTRNLPSSDILKSVRGPVIAVSSWASFLAILHMKLLKTNPQAAANMCIPPTAHSLMVSALGLLLVFRTNSAYQRFVEGRKIWGEIVNSARDLYRYIMMYEKEIGIEKRRRIQRLLAAFPFLLRHRVRPNLVMHRVDDQLIARDPKNTLLLYQDRALPDNDPEAAAVANQEANTGKSRRKTRPLYWVDKRTLPWRLLPVGALENCARAQNRPLWVIDRMAQELRTVPDGPDFTNRERLTLISHVDKLSRLIGDCERIHQTAVPLNYARHSLRALTLWLFTLPFALVQDLKMITGPALFLVAWLLFGVYEIGVAIEDPFQGTLRLSIICDTIRRDVLGDEIIRCTAFDVGDDSDLDDDDDDDDADENDEVKYYDEENKPVVANATTSSSKESDTVSLSSISGKDGVAESKGSDKEGREPKAFE